MRATFLLVLTLVGLLVALAACATPATPTATPTSASIKPTVASVSSASSMASGTVSCTTTDAAPLDKFRADEPTKFAAKTGKPKLVEFFAYW